MIESKETLTGNIISKQTISGSVNTSKVKMLPELEDITIIPTTEQQIFTHKNSEGYDKVTVNAIPSEYIVPSGTKEITSNGEHNIKEYEKANVNIVFTPNLQDKSISITENGTQNIVADDGYDGLGNVEVSVNVEGGGISQTVQQPYIYGQDTNIMESSGTTLSITLGSQVFGYKAGKINMALVFGYARSNYTISDNVTIIAEKTSISDASTTQRLFVGYCSFIDETQITLKQETSGRLGLGKILLSNCDIPIAVDDVEGTIDTSIDISTDDNLNIYLFSQCYNAVLKGVNFNEWYYNARLGLFISNYASDDKQITITDKSFNTVLHIRCPFKQI